MLWQCLILAIYKKCEHFSGNTIYLRETIITTMYFTNSQSLNNLVLRSRYSVCTHCSLQARHKQAIITFRNIRHSTVQSMAPFVTTITAYPIYNTSIIIFCLDSSRWIFPSTLNTFILVTAPWFMLCIQFSAGLGPWPLFCRDFLLCSTHPVTMYLA